MTEKTATNLLATINDIALEAKERFGVAPPRAFVSAAMKSRIVEEAAEHLQVDFKGLRRKAQHGLKLVGIRFDVDHRVPDDEIHFCTKRREIMCRVKVDQSPMAYAGTDLGKSSVSPQVA